MRWSQVTKLFYKRSNLARNQRSWQTTVWIGSRAPWGQYAQGGRKLTCPLGKSTAALEPQPAAPSRQGRTYLISSQSLATHLVAWLCKLCHWIVSVYILLVLLVNRLKEEEDLKSFVGIGFIWNRKIYVRTRNYKSDDNINIIRN